MMQPRTLLLASTLFVMSCSSEARESEPPAASTLNPAPAEEAPPEPEKVVYIYDVEGALLPSEEFLVGIQLPRGLELFRQEKGVHVYRIQAPIEKVLKYFGPKLITGRVERQGKGAVYRTASVRGSEVNPTKVDVSILEIGNRLTRVAITELPPPPAYPPAQQETLQRARRDFQSLD